MLRGINPQIMIKESWPSGLKRCFTSRGVTWRGVESRWRHNFIFILNILNQACSEQLSRSHANEIKHDNSPAVIVV